MGCHHSTPMLDVTDVIELRTPHTSDNETSVDFHHKYKLHGRIGQGQYGRVYLCDRREAGSSELPEFAVKISDLRAAFDGELKVQNQAEDMANLEVSMLKRIGQHKHICSLVDFAKDARFHYIVLENGGATLQSTLQNMPELTEKTLGKVVQEMLLGVAAVHAVRMVHRDVKPDNFLCLGHDKTVKLCDFGFAAVPPDDCKGLNGSCGTPPFMPPEMLSGDQCGAAGDIWSLGVSVYALLVGEFPYVPKKPDSWLMMEAIRCGVPEPRFCPSAPGAAQPSPEASSLLRALLHRTASCRPTAMEAIGHAWFRLERGRDSSWRPPCLKRTLRSAVRQGAFTARRSSAEELPPGWERRECRSTRGEYYYANPSAGLSQFERPKALDAVDLALRELQHSYDGERHAHDARNDACGSDSSGDDGDHFAEMVSTGSRASANSTLRGDLSVPSEETITICLNMDADWLCEADDAELFEGLHKQLPWGSATRLPDGSI